MKLLLLYAVLVLPLSMRPRTNTLTLTLAWDASAGAAGYNLYYGPAKHVYTNKVSAGPYLSKTLGSLNPAAKYHFAVTAVGATGLESDFSNDVLYAAPAPLTNRVVSVQGALETSPSVLGPWTPNWESPWVRTNAQPRQQFFRGLSVTITNWSY